MGNKAIPTCSADIKLLLFFFFHFPHAGWFSTFLFLAACAARPALPDWYLSREHHHVPLFRPRWQVVFGYQSQGYEIEDSSITTYAHEILTSYLRKEYVDIWLVGHLGNPTFSFVDAPPWIFRYSIIIKTLDCVTMVKVLSGPGIEVSMFYVYHR